MLSINQATMATLNPTLTLILALILWAMLQYQLLKNVRAFNRNVMNLSNDKPLSLCKGQVQKGVTHWQGCLCSRFQQCEQLAIGGKTKGWVNQG